MGWYKFLVYFALFASCVINVIGGLSTMTGMIYRGERDLVYMFFGGMRVVDLLIGAAMLAMAVLSIIVRQKLAQFRKDGPFYLLILYGTSIAASVLYLILATAIVGEWFLTPELTSQYICTIGISVLMIVVNHIYFKKRASLFVN